MKKKFFFSRWLNNSYILFVFAVVISLIIWLYMSFSSSANDTTYVINDIPIQVELSDEAKKLELQVFMTGEPKASVTVTGNRTVLGLVRDSDVTVTAATGSISSAGNYTLAVTANKRSSRSSFEVKGVTPSTIGVMVDYYKESEFPIQDNIIYEAADGYYSSISKPFDTINVAGPQSEILKIKKVLARANISNKINESREVDAEIVLLDEYDNEISQKFLTLSNETVKATVNVLPEKEVAIEPVFVNKPDGLTISEDMITITPSSIQIAGPADSLEDLKSLELEPIDFSTIRNEKVDFDNLGINIPENCRSIDNYNTADVSLDFSSLTAKSFTVDQFTVEGLSDEYTSKITSKSIDVTVVGTKAEIEKLSAAQITAIIDTSDSSGKTGSVEMPVKFKFSGVTGCWAYGSYQANITISKK